MDNIDELAAVICHEIGHISARHLSKRIEQSKNIGLVTLAGILAGMFLGGEVAGAMITGSIAAGMQAQLHYSREDERQADQLSYKYMEPAGFDPGGMVSALNKIQKGSWLGTGKVPAYLLTHPTGPERMANLEALLTSYTPRPLSKEAALLKARFPVFKTVIGASSLDSRDAERLFNRELEKDQEAPLPHFGLGMVYIKEGRYGVTVVGFSNGNIKYINAAVAIEQRYVDPKIVSVYERMGVCFGRTPQQDPAYLDMLCEEKESIKRYLSL
jgi:hypothetical protein